MVDDVEAMALSRNYGFPRSDIERVMIHYGVGYEEAVQGMSEGRYPLPARGAKLQNSTNWLMVISGVAAILSGIVLLYKGAEGS